MANRWASSRRWRPSAIEAEANGFKDIQSIFVGYGSGEVIDSCLTALLNPGDNVLTPSPEYPLYGAVLAKLDAVPNAYDLDEANGWEPDLADMERKINPRRGRSC